MERSTTEACSGEVRGNRKHMERHTVIQELIDVNSYKTYLEIGVLGGNVFFGIKCSRKIAVDPEFRFNWKGRLGETLRNPVNLKATYFETTSDEFFEKDAGDLFKKKKLDIALIDGMHEFDYVLNDVNNCLTHLAANGILVLHDCNPVTPEAEVPFNEWKARGYSGHWNGDVWKVIPYLKKYRPDVNVFVADCDHGLGIITTNKGFVHRGTVDRRGVAEEVSEGGGRDEFRNLSYNDLEKQRSTLLNLKPASYLGEFLKKPVGTL